MTDQQQTAHIDALRERLQSIAIQAVRAQEAIGTPDACLDLLADIDRDREAAEKLASAIASDTAILGPRIQSDADGID